MRRRKAERRLVDLGKRGKMMRLFENLKMWEFDDEII